MLEVVFTRPNSSRLIFLTPYVNFINPQHWRIMVPIISKKVHRITPVDVSRLEERLYGLTDLADRRFLSFPNSSSQVRIELRISDFQVIEDSSDITGSDADFDNEDETEQRVELNQNHRRGFEDVPRSREAFGNPRFFPVQQGDEDASVVCTICLEEMMRGERIWLTLCSHLFHSDCMCRWLRVGRFCPICRSKLHC